jgi:hypothetical protein
MKNYMNTIELDLLTPAQWKEQIEDLESQDSLEPLDKRKLAHLREKVRIYETKKQEHQNAVDYNF